MPASNLIQKLTAESTKISVEMPLIINSSGSTLTDY